MNKKHLLPSALSLTTARVLAQPVIWYTESASKALLYPQPLKEQSFQRDQRELQVFPSCWEEFRLTLTAVMSHTPQRDVSQRKEKAAGLMDVERRVGKECEKENALQYYLGVLPSLYHEISPSPSACSDEDFLYVCLFSQRNSCFLPLFSFTPH